MTQETKEQFSMWSIPKSSWTTRADVDAVAITEDMVERYREARLQDDMEEQERVRPFRTPVTADALSRSVE